LTRGERLTQKQTSGDRRKPSRLVFSGKHVQAWIALGGVHKREFIVLVSLTCIGMDGEDCKDMQYYSLII
jgi:hypothetical protein